MKLIAALCMLIDHIGLVFFPMDIRWRIIGRLAMPIFAYGVARGAFCTTSLKRYVKKMLLFSFISQIPFWGMRYVGLGDSFISLNLNVGFTFLLALIAIMCLKIGGIMPKYKADEETAFKEISYGKKGIAVIGVTLCIVLADILHCDYGSYGVLMVLMGYLLYCNKNHLIYMSLGYVMLTLLFNGYDIALCILQGIGVIAYGIIYMTRQLSEKKLGKFFYWFYPVHMLVIVAIKWWSLRC